VGRDPDRCELDRPSCGLDVDKYPVLGAGVVHAHAVADEFAPVVSQVNRFAALVQVVVALFALRTGRT
jgi:hypothetical protein